MDERDQIIARLAVLETISVFALALYLAHVSNDPDGSKVRAMLAALQHDGEAALSGLPAEMQQEGAGVLRELLNRAAEMSFALRPHGGPQAH